MIRQRLRQTTVDLTTRREPAPSFLPAELLNVLGLDGARFREDTVAADSLSYLSLGDGKWDERSGGAVAIKTRLGLDEDGRLRCLTTMLLCQEPNGSSTTHKFCEIDTRLVGAKIKLHALHILGRTINVTHGEQIARVFGLLHRVHADLRNLRFPEIAQIIEDFKISAMLSQGEKNLVVPGLSPEGGFSFPVLTSSTKTIATTPFELPYEFAAELIGCGPNDLDPARTFGNARSQIGAHPDHGQLFRLSATWDNTALQASIKPFAAKPGQGDTDLIHLTGRNFDGKFLIDQFSLRGEPSEALATMTRQLRLGVVHRSIMDMRAGHYPSVPAHLASFNQHSLLDRSALRSTLDCFSQMSVIPFCGHNSQEYLPGFGGTIGGNCKGIFSSWRDENGGAKRKGVLVDLGIVFSKKNGIQTGDHGSWDWVVPDTTAYLDDIDDILVTHLHADHMQGIVDYARCGLLHGKTIHVAKYDARVLTQFLKKEKVSEKDWPTINALDGEGWIDVKDGDQQVLSVYYSTNAIPHSTNVTAFAMAPPPYIKDANGTIIDNPHYWSYASLGDMSFGRYNLPDYESEKPPDTGLKRDFFAKFKAGLREKFPDLSPGMRRKVNRINVVEIDPTSIHRDGWAPDIVTVHRNWLRLHSWFSDKGMVVPNLSTSKRAHEMMFRFAVESGRNVSAEGAYLEDRWRDMNIMGVNTDVLPSSGEGGEIQNYLDWWAGKNGLAPVIHRGRTGKEWKEVVAETPWKTLILATGSQGSEIEKDSVGTQVGEGRSRFQLDPKYCPAAYDTDPKNFIWIYAQGAIPGHEDEQLAQLRKTAYDNDLMVAAAVHNGARFFNLKEPYLSCIIDDLKASGDKFTLEPNGGIFIHGLSIYAPGHGWKEDYRQGFFPWFKENGIQSIGVQHYPRDESVRVAYALADEFGFYHPSEPTPNHVVCTMEHGKKFAITGHLTPSFFLARNNRRADKYHGGTVEYKQAIFMRGDAAVDNNGIFAGNDNAAFFRDYGQFDYSQSKYDGTLPPICSRRDFDPRMTRGDFHLGVRAHLPVRGPSNPLDRGVASHIQAAGMR